MASPHLDTVLVTGGCGFIGSFIVEAFAAEPAFSVVAASRNPSRYRVPGVKYLSCDITNREQVQELIAAVQPRIVVHTVSPGVFALPREHYRISYLGTKCVLEICKRHPSVRAFVWTSSPEAVQLDPSKNHRPIDETEAKVNTFNSRHASAYGRSKGATETMVLGFSTDATTVDFSEDANWAGLLLTTSIRITGLYGPRDPTTIPEMLRVMETFVTRIQVGPNKLVHSWVYVESAANAHVDAAKALLDGQHLRPEMRVDGEAFFIADPTPMKMWDFSRAVWKAAGHPKDDQKVLVIPFWLMITLASIGEWIFWIFTFGTKRPRVTTDHFVSMAGGSWFSIETAKKRIGYEPVCDTTDGIRKSVEWFQKAKKMERSHD
jgi:sterol-4alpha-carboxylate 3-dehydrogenase (decarboxylating)